MSKLLQTIHTYRQMVWTAVEPDQQTWQGATYGLAAVTLLLIIDRSERGVVVLDEIGFRR